MKVNIVMLGFYALILLGGTKFLFSIPPLEHPIIYSFSFIVILVCIAAMKTIWNDIRYAN